MLAGTTGNYCQIISTVFSHKIGLKIPGERQEEAATIVTWELFPVINICSNETLKAKQHKIWGRPEKILMLTLVFLAFWENGANCFYLDRYSPVHNFGYSALDYFLFLLQYFHCFPPLLSGTLVIPTQKNMLMCI